jgi:hypothetical protein
MLLHNISEIEIIYKPQKWDSTIISNAKDAEKIFRHTWNNDTIEYFEEFKVMYLNRLNQVLGIYSHSRGGLIGSICAIFV